jgi:hypothetical protein
MERAERAKADAAAEAQQVAKTLEEERVKAERATPTYQPLVFDATRHGAAPARGVAVQDVAADHAGLPRHVVASGDVPRYDAQEYTMYRDESLRSITTLYNEGEQHMNDVLATAQRALYADMSQYVKLYANAPPSAIETAGERKVAPAAVAEAEGDKYDALLLKYTQLRVDHTARGKRVSELEAETSRLRRDLRERSEYGLYRQRGGARSRARARRPPRLGRGAQWGRGACPREEGGVARGRGGRGAPEALEAGPRQPRCLRRRAAAWRAAKP